MSREGKEIHIRAGRKMDMDNIKIMLFDVSYCLREMVIRLEMSLPGDTGSNFTPDTFFALGRSK